MDRGPKPRAAPAPAPAAATPAVNDAEARQMQSVKISTETLSRFMGVSAQVLIDALVTIKARPGWLIVISAHTDS